MVRGTLVRSSQSQLPWGTDRTMEIGGRCTVAGVPRSLDGRVRGLDTQEGLVGANEITWAIGSSLIATQIIPRNHDGADGRSTIGEIWAHERYWWFCATIGTLMALTLPSWLIYLFYIWVQGALSSLLDLPR